MKRKTITIGIIVLFLTTTITPLTQGVVKKAPNHPVFKLGEDPIIVRITISPENPAPLSTITFTAEIKGENITEVYMWVKEANDIMCMPTRNFSMNKINEEIYVCTITLEFADATYFGYKPLIFCNGSWYEFEWRSQTLNIEGTIFYVGGTGPNNYTRIQDAIDNASDGDTVFVYIGHYYENLFINKTISLIGEDRSTTIIDGSLNGNVVNISADSVSISRFTIQKSGLVSYISGIIIHSNQNTIIKNTISNNYFGVTIYSKNNTIEDNNISFNKGHGLGILEAVSNKIEGNIISFNEEAGVFLRNSANSLINNIISHNDRGITGYWCRDIIENNNIFSNNKLGIHFMGNKNNIIKGNNIISHKTYGICIEGSNNIVSGNTIKDTRGLFPSFGIRIYGSKNNITYNIISKTIGFMSYGLYLSGSDNNITGNTISGTKGFRGFGLKLDLCKNTTITKNNFIKNTKNAHFYTNIEYIKSNLWKQNYWDRPWILSKPIFGSAVILNKFNYRAILIPWLNFDWHPAKKPYDI